MTEERLMRLALLLLGIFTAMTTLATRVDSTGTGLPTYWKNSAFIGIWPTSEMTPWLIPNPSNPPTAMAARLSRTYWARI